MKHTDYIDISPQPRKGALWITVDMRIPGETYASTRSYSIMPKVPDRSFRVHDVLTKLTEVTRILRGCSLQLRKYVE